MPSIISTGIGSGLDIAGIVQQLVAAEARPAETRFASQEARAQVKLSAYGSVLSALSEFRDTVKVMRDLDEFLVRQANSENEEVFKAVAGTTALPATYSIEVVQMAQAQKLGSGAFADADTVVGTGTLTVTVGTVSVDIEITDENNTLTAIRDALNEAADVTGVQATIVNADAGSHLIITSENTGAASAITITQAGGDGGLASLEYDPGNGLNSLTELTAAQDAHIRIDGYDVMGANNSISGAIDGVAIDLIEAEPGQTYELAVVNDKAAVSETVNGFVDGYNQLIELLDKLTAFDVETQTAGPLLGDAAARTVRDHIRRELSDVVNGIDAGFSTLSEVGIRFQLDGTLQVDDARLSDTLDQDFSDFGRLFANDDGYAVRLADLLEQYLGDDGALQARTDGLKARIDDIAEQREALGLRLEQLETRLLRQFNALDSLLGQLSQTSNFLAQQLDNLPGFKPPASKD